MTLLAAFVAWLFLIFAFWQARAGNVPNTMIDAGIAIACLVYLSDRWTARFTTTETTED